jgi:aspartate racemase
MQEPFYKQRLKEKHGIDVVLPSAEDQELVHSVIYEELCQGEFTEESKQEYRRIIEQLQAEGADGVILACTEIGQLINYEDTDVPLFDTTAIHAEAAIDWMLAKREQAAA